MKSQVHMSFLKEGTFINTRLGSSITWYKNIVYKTDDEYVCISLADNFLENSIMIGANILIKYETEYFEYLYNGVVADIVLEHPKYVSIQITHTEELVNSRAFPRHDAYIPFKIKPIWNKNFVFSVVTNISLTGVAFVSNQHLNYNEECEMLLYLPNNKTIDAKGKLVRKSAKTGFIDYGMQFTEMTEENSIMLSEYFNFMEENIRQMQNDYHKNIKKYFIKIH